MSWYEIYGPVVRRIRGTCSIVTTVGEFDGPFHLIQTSSGSLYMQVQISGTLPDVFRLLQLPMPGPQIAVTGRASDGEAFSATAYGVLDVNFSPPGELTSIVGISQAVLGTQVDVPRRSRYGLVNVRFTGNRQTPIRRALRPAMGFDLPGKQTVVARPIPKYRETEKMLRVQNASALTCIATTSAPPATIEQLCHMISLIQGTVVNWIVREDFEGNKKVCTHLSNRVTRPYSNLQLLPTQEPHVTPNFVNETWEQFAAAFDDYRLNAVIRLSAFARQGKDSDLEGRGIVLSTILDLLAASHAAKTRTDLRMKRPEFGRGVKVWKPLVEEALRTAYGDRGDLPELLSVISGGLRRTTFRERLISLGQNLHVSSIRSDATRAVELRNRLVHSGRFLRPEEAVEDLFWLMGFVDRLVLRLVGYRGNHVTYSSTGPVVEPV